MIAPRPVHRDPAASAVQLPCAPVKQALHIASFGLGLAILYGIARWIGIDAIAADLRRLDLWVFAPATVLYGAAWYFRAFRFQRLMRAFERRVAFVPALCVEIGGNFANLVAPAKLGDAVKVFYLRRRYDLPILQGTLAAVLVRGFDLVAVLLLVVATLPFLASETVRGFATPIGVGVVLLAASSGAAAVLYARPGWLAAMLVGPLARLAPLYERVVETYRAHIGEFGRVLALSLPVWLFDSLVLHVFLSAFGVELGYPRTVFVLVVANLVKTLPVTPGAVGVFEAVLVFLLGAFGVEASVALSVALVDHGYKNLFTLVLGGIFLQHLGVSLGGVARARVEEGV